MGASIGRSLGWGLVFGGLVLLALAAAFWIIPTLVGDPVADDELEGVRLILAVGSVVMVAVGVVLVRGAGATDRIARQGLAGTAEIVGVQQTGMFVNNNPQVALDLEVRVIGQSPYRATVKEVVPLVMLSRLQGTVPVRVDPTDPQRVVVRWDLVAAGGPGGTGGMGGGPGSSADESLAQVAAAMAASGSTDAAPVFEGADQGSVSIEEIRAWLRANGISGTARIDRLEDSGQTIGDERLFTMTTTVSIPGRATKTTDPSAAMVPLEKVGRVAVGVVLPVKVAPDNPDLLMFEWDKI